MKQEQKCLGTANKEEKFKCLATCRTNEILKKIKTLGNCANRSAYVYNRGQIDKIFGTIEKCIVDTKAQFYFPNEKEDKFEL